jgi:hypothetical protein
VKRVVDRTYVLSEHELKLAVIEWLKGQGFHAPKAMDRGEASWSFEFAEEPSCTIHWQEREMLTKPGGE